MKKIFKTAIAAATIIVFGALSAGTAYAATMADDIYNALKKADKTIDLSAYGVSPQEAMNTYLQIVSDNPDLFYVNLNVECQYEKTGGTCTELICSYNTSDVSGARKAFDTEVNKVVASAKGLTSQFDKAKAVHDYMVENYDYDMSGSNATAYDMATKGTGMCTSYTGIYKAAMDKLGIPCKTAISTDMGHEWNIVQIDGKWYHVDVTWDDPIGGNGITYANFLKSDKLMQMTGHFNWNVNGGVSCTDTSYDTMG